MKYAAFFLVILFCAIGTFARADEQADTHIIVTSNGWHSGIVLARSSLPPDSIPETADFPNAAYFEFGWGDAEYYPARRPTFGMALKAAFPGPAVLHLSGLPDHPAKIFPKVEWVEIPLSAEGLAQLIASLRASFERGDSPRTWETAPGLHAFSKFYPATGRFSLNNTCNTWTARLLAEAGVPVEHARVQQAEELMVQLRALDRASP